jgi:hypothetical protein
VRAATSKFLIAIFTLLVNGCGAVNQPPAAAPAAVPAFSFDGTYTGTIRLTSSGTSQNPRKPNWCGTPPQISLFVENNTFTYNLTRPKAPSLIFTAVVAPDGTISGSAADGEATMFGLIAGGQISGQIAGTACNYAFAAELGK